MEELLKDEHAGSISERDASHAHATLAGLQKVAKARKPGVLGRERGQAISP
jgi:hypothetical protein